MEERKDDEVQQKEGQQEDEVELKEGKKEDRKMRWKERKELQYFCTGLLVSPPYSSSYRFSFSFQLQEHAQICPTSAQMASV